MTKILKAIIKAILWLIDPDHRRRETISDGNDHTLTHYQPILFKSDFNNAIAVMRTVPYDVWELKTPSFTLRAADRHRIITASGAAVWMEDLLPGDLITTENGLEIVVYCIPLNVRVHMYSLEIDIPPEYGSR